MPKFNIDLSSIDTSNRGGWRAYPTGTYRAIISNTECKTTRAGNGKFIEVTYKFLADPAKGKEFRDRYNIENPSTKAVEIGHESLAKLGEACGLDPLFLQNQGSEALDGRTVIIDLVKEPAGNPDFGDSDGNQNRIASWSAANGAAPAPEPEMRAPASDDVPF